MNSETKYSKHPFDGYTHRFIVQFEIGEPYFSNLDIYSNSDSYQELEEYINLNKKEKVISFKIFHRASKEQDDNVTRLIEETLKDI